MKHKKEKTADTIRSLSGLVNYKGFVIGISDEFYGLFVRSRQYDIFHNFSKFPDGIGYFEQKKLKPDFESISLVTYQGKDFLLAFPSLSKPNRDQVGLFQVSVVENQLKIHSQKKYKIGQLLSLLSKTSAELNIEGHIFHSDQLFLLNRGNQNMANEFINIERGQRWLHSAIEHDSDVDFSYSMTKNCVDLGAFQGHLIHWTEGIWDGDSILFLGTVEKTDNAYDDGDVLASFLGRFDFKSNKVLGLKKILDFKKAEGICRWESKYLVAIDSDSAEMSNEFYSLQLGVLD